MFGYLANSGAPYNEDFSLRIFISIRNAHYVNTLSSSNLTVDWYAHIKAYSNVVVDDEVHDDDDDDDNNNLSILNYDSILSVDPDNLNISFSPTYLSTERHSFLWILSDHYTTLTEYSIEIFTRRKAWKAFYQEQL